MKRDGNIDILGRSDNCIKIGSRRVELSEIEYHLNTFHLVHKVIDFCSSKSLVLTLHTGDCVIAFQLSLCICTTTRSCERETKFDELHTKAHGSKSSKLDGTSAVYILVIVSSDAFWKDRFLHLHLCSSVCEGGERKKQN